MAITVEEARKIVFDSTIHTNETAFSTLKVDRAIIAACNRFLRETKVARRTDTFATVASTATYDLDTEIESGFRSDQIIGVPHIASPDWRPLQVVDYEIVRREHDVTAASQRPEMIAFNGATATMYPTPDAAYTIAMRSWELLDTTNWTAGGNDPTTRAKTLNIPDRWSYDVLWFGARGYLLLGAPGHTDGPAAMAEFTGSVIPNATGEGQRGGAWWPSAKGTHEQTYGPRPRL